jgi:hypothetical protein
LGEIKIEDTSMKKSFLNGATAHGVVAALSLAIAQLANAHTYPERQVPPPGASMSVVTDRRIGANPGSA